MMHGWMDELMDDGFRLSQQCAHFPRWSWQQDSFHRNTLIHQKERGKEEHGFPEQHSDHFCLVLSLQGDLCFLSHCLVHICGPSKSCRETGNPVKTGQPATEQGEGAVNIRWVLSSSPEGRSTQGLNLNRTSARCESFQSFLCMDKSSGKSVY